MRATFKDKKGNEHLVTQSGNRLSLHTFNGTIHFVIPQDVSGRVCRAMKRSSWAVMAKVIDDCVMTPTPVEAP